MTWLQADADRLSHLFDLAHQLTETDIAALPDTDQQEIILLRRLLDAIDTAWQASDASVERVNALFLQKLAAKDPRHPWVQGNIVHTLGDLIQVSSDKPASLPDTIYAQLAQDTTPVEVFLDPAMRIRAAGQAAQRAGIPRMLISDFIIWVNRLVASLVRPSGSEQQGLIFPRRQNQRQRGPKHDS